MQLFCNFLLPFNGNRFLALLTLTMILNLLRFFFGLRYSFSLATFLLPSHGNFILPKKKRACLFFSEGGNFRPNFARFFAFIHLNKIARSPKYGHFLFGCVQNCNFLLPCCKIRIFPNFFFFPKTGVAFFSART